MSERHQRPLDRIAATPLAVDARGDSIRVVVAADKYTVANISSGMNDREEYARLFAVAPALMQAGDALAEAAQEFILAVCDDRDDWDVIANRLNEQVYTFRKIALSPFSGGAQDAPRAVQVGDHPPELPASQPERKTKP